MGEFNPFRWLVVLTILFVVALAVPWIVYRHGTKVGDATGYMRGYKEGQQSGEGHLQSKRQ
jgi:hypothetical protein